MMNSVRAWARSQKWYLKLRAHQRFGVARSLRRWARESAILNTPPVHTAAAGGSGPCEVHMLTWQGDWLMALWALKSFYYFARVDYPLYFHVGGELSDHARGTLARHFPQAALVGLHEADQQVEPVLLAKRLNNLLAARQTSVLFRKIIDVALIGAAPNVLLLDSDVLFFDAPTELLRVASAPLDHFVFNRDFNSAYALSDEQARELFGLDLPPCVNVGLGVVPRAAVSLELADEWLKRGVPADCFPEQTLYALLAARAALAYLPEAYATIEGDVDLTRTRLVTRHYCGWLRHLFFDEGIPYLKKHTRLLSSPC